MSYLSELRAVLGNRALPAVGVSVLLQDETGRVLLQRRGDDGQWGILGGRLEPGEEFLTAAHRELLEETGLRCPNLRPLPLSEGLVSGPQFWHRYPNGDEVYLVGLRTEGTVPAAALAAACPDDSGETLELRWFALDDLPTLNTNINRVSMNVLRARRGLSLLPLLNVPPPPLPGNWLRDLRALVGSRPLLAPGANVAVTNEHGEVLLLKHAGTGNTVTGKWTLPGGSLEPGESFAECAARELHEETGLRASHLVPVELFAGAEYRFTSLNGDVIDNISVLFRAEDVQGELALDTAESHGAAWFAPDALPPADELSGPLIRAKVKRWQELEPSPNEGACPGAAPHRLC